MLTTTDKACNTCIKKGDWNMVRVSQYYKAKQSKHRIRIVLFCLIVAVISFKLGGI